MDSGKHLVMLPMFNKVSFLRTTVLVWAMTWMIVVPLFHIHPEADHRHGAADHRHGGTVHAVFSPDLNCEFSIYNHAVVAGSESHCPLHLIAQPLHGFDHFTIDVALAASAESQVGKGTALDVAAHFFQTPPPARPHAVWQPQPSHSLTNLYLTTSLSSRAPPIG
jgi:hypothetical protein